jgi:tetrahydromethanopterin S-methyltransferase subunit D
MTLTLDIKPEVQAELARQAIAQGRAIETIAAALLEEAVHPVAAPLSASAEATASGPVTGQAIIDAFAEIRGLLTDEEIDRMFTRSPSTARPVDLS